jgi:aminopeptidase C
MEDYPVAFSCDIDQFTSNSSGFLDTEMYQYEKAFGAKFGVYSFYSFNLVTHIS